VALFSYLQRIQLLLNDVTAAVYNDADLITYTNLARQQVAGAAGCVRNYGSLSVVSGTQVYAFTSISGLATGVSGVLRVRQINYTIASGAARVTNRPFEWFNSWVYAQATPVPAAPSVWAQFGQGAAGSIYINVPDASYTLNLDCVCLPNDLAQDQDTDVIPYPWTEAVPFYACHYALLSERKVDEAKMMLDTFDQYMARGRMNANPSVLAHNFEQHKDPMEATRLGLVSK
jgi:hypothetical protein